MITGTADVDVLAAGATVITAFANAAGLPAIAVPAGFEDALPCGFQLVAARGNDASLFALALAYEQAFPSQRTWPVDSVSSAGAIGARRCFLKKRCDAFIGLGGDGFRAGRPA